MRKYTHQIYHKTHLIISDRSVETAAATHSQSQAHKHASSLKLSSPTRLQPVTSRVRFHTVTHEESGSAHEAYDVPNNKTNARKAMSSSLKQTHVRPSLERAASDNNNDTISTQVLADDVKIASIGTNQHAATTETTMLVAHQQPISFTSGQADYLGVPDHTDSHHSPITQRYMQFRVSLGPAQSGIQPSMSNETVQPVDAPPTTKVPAVESAIGGQVTSHRSIVAQRSNTFPEQPSSVPDFDSFVHEMERAEPEVMLGTRSLRLDGTTQASSATDAEGVLI